MLSLVATRRLISAPTARAVAPRNVHAIRETRRSHSNQVTSLVSSCDRFLLRLRVSCLLEIGFCYENKSWLSGLRFRSQHDIEPHVSESCAKALCFRGALVFRQWCTHGLTIGL